MIRGRMVTRMSNQGVCREKRTNRDLWPTIRVLHIRRCGGGCDAQPGRGDFTIAPPMRVVKRFARFVNRCADWISSAFTWAVDNCRTRLADGAVKAPSRAQRGRSNAQRLDRADANLTIGLDGPQTDGIDPPAFAAVLGEIRRGLITSRRAIDEPGACSDSVA